MYSIRRPFACHSFGARRKASPKCKGNHGCDRVLESRATECIGKRFSDRSGLERVVATAICSSQHGKVNHQAPHWQYTTYATISNAIILCVARPGSDIPGAANSLGYLALSSTSAGEPRV